MMLDNDSEVRKDGKRLHKILLDDNEWHLIKQLVEILEQFDTITSTLSGRDFVTLSLVTPLIFFLKKIFLEILVTLGNQDDNNDDFNNETIEPINDNELIEESNDDSPILLEENNEGEIELYEENMVKEGKKK